MTTIADSEGGAANPKLPLREIISLSYSTYFHYFSDVLRISWLWLVLALPLTAIGGWLQSSWMTQAITSMAAGQAPPRPLMLVVLANLSTLALTFAGVSIAVAWHRRLLLDEAPGLSGSNVLTASLWRYIGVGIAIGLIMLLPAAVILLPVLASRSPDIIGDGAANLIAISLVFALYVWVAVIMMRLCLLLPARAIGDDSLTFKQAWNRSRGNFWRIFWGITACWTPPLIALEIIALVFVGFPNPEAVASGEHIMAWAAAGFLFSCGNLLVVPIWIGFLSHVYRHFFRPA